MSETPATTWKKRRRITINVSPSDALAIKEAAEKARLTISDYIRRTILTLLREGNTPTIDPCPTCPNRPKGTSSNQTSLQERER